MKKTFYILIAAMVVVICAACYIVYLLFDLMKAFDELEGELNSKEPGPVVDVPHEEIYSQNGQTKHETQEVP